jgi:ubiquinone/menaquinone biosynthesis C-methylase UbiE
MIDEQGLYQLLDPSVSLRSVEPNIYSVYPEGESTNSYDKMGRVYDLVAGNRFYNRLVWGYWTAEFATFCNDCLRSSEDGIVLDAGCGSLVFTAKTYAGYSERPVVLLDGSIRMLKTAKARMVKLKGRVPSNMVFLHASALELPFNPKVFSTIIAMNVLHVLEDAQKAVQELRDVMIPGGTVSLTTLIINNRYADGYLRMLENTGEAIPRTREEVLATFDTLDMRTEDRVQGNILFVSCRT